MPESVTVEELVKNVRLKVLQGEDYLQRPIVTSDICRPALEFAGYFTHYPAERIQLLGIIHDKNVYAADAMFRNLNGPADSN